MSYWHFSQSEREISLMKQKYMANILQFNKQIVEEKNKYKRIETENLQSYLARSNKEALSALVEENNRYHKRMSEQKQMLRGAYERQIREKEEREKRLKQQEILYFNNQRQRLQMEESRRVRQLSKIFNRVSYYAQPVYSVDRRRTKTEMDEHNYSYNPENKSGFLMKPVQKSLDNIEVQPVQRQQERKIFTQLFKPEGVDEKMNYSFHKKGAP